MFDFEEGVTALLGLRRVLPGDGQLLVLSRLRRQPSPRPVLSPEPHTRQHQPLVRSVGVQGTHFPTTDGAPAFWEPRGSRRTSTPSTGSPLSESTTVTTMCPAEIGLHRTVSFRAGSAGAAGLDEWRTS